MVRMPTITSDLMIDFLRDLGSSVVRQKGSHIFLRHPYGRTATVPRNEGKDLGQGITSKILRDAEVAREAFLAWYAKK